MQKGIGNMTAFAVAAAAITVIHVLAPQARAQGAQTPNEPVQQPATQTGVQPQAGGTAAQGAQAKMRASELLDFRVMTRDGQKTGQVEDALLSQDSRTIEHLVVSFDDNRETMMTVPMKEVTRASERRILIVKTDAGKMLTGDQWPKTQGRISQLIGRDVTSGEGEQIGTIRDLVIRADGRIDNVAIATVESAGAASKLASVDWPQLRLQADQRSATVNLSRQRVQQMATGEQEYWQRFGFVGDTTQPKSDQDKKDKSKSEQDQKYKTQPQGEQPKNCNSDTGEAGVRCAGGDR